MIVEGLVYSLGIKLGNEENLIEGSQDEETQNQESLKNDLSNDNNENNNEESEIFENKLEKELQNKVLRGMNASVCVFSGLEAVVRKRDYQSRWWGMVGQSFGLIELGLFQEAQKLLDQASTIKIETQTDIQSAFYLAVSALLMLRQQKRNEAFKMANAAYHFLVRNSTSPILLCDVVIIRLIAEIHFSLLEYYHVTLQQKADLRKQLLLVAKDDLDFMYNLSHTIPLVQPIFFRFQVLFLFFFLFFFFLLSSFYFFFYFHFFFFFFSFSSPSLFFFFFFFKIN